MSKMTVKSGLDEMSVKEDRQNVTIRMLPSLKKAAHRAAIGWDMSLSDLVERAVERLLKTE